MSFVHQPFGRLDFDICIGILVNKVEGNKNRGVFEEKTLCVPKADRKGSLAFFMPMAAPKRTIGVSISTLLGKELWSIL